VWDLRYEPPKGAKRQFSIAAVYRSTPTGPQGPFVHPGTYQVKLIVDGEVSVRSFKVLMDPRLSISDDALQLHTDLSMDCYQAYHDLQTIVELIDAEPKSSKMQLALRGTGQVGNPDTMYGSISQVEVEEETLVGLQHKFLFVLNLLQAADSEPTSQTIEAVRLLQETKESLMQRWLKIK
jgi:hypothetical protein